MIIFGFALNALILGIILVVLLKEDVFDSIPMLLTVVAAPSVAAMIPPIFIGGTIGEILGIIVFTLTFYALISFCYNLSRSEAIKAIVYFIAFRFLIGLLISALAS